MAEPLRTRRSFHASPRSRGAAGAFLASLTSLPFLAFLAAAGCARAVQSELPQAGRPAVAYAALPVPAQGPTLAAPPAGPAGAVVALRLDPRSGALPPRPGSARPGPPPEPARAADVTPEGLRYATQSGVRLPPIVEQKVERIAEAYFRRTGRELVVTSGTRDAAEQAEAMHELFRLGADVMSLYKNKAAATEIQRVYDGGRAAARPAAAVMAAMAEVIRRQMQRGVFLSAHLREGAVDIRNRDMSGADKRAFLDAVAEVGGVTALEETRPPHFHLQVD